MYYYLSYTNTTLVFSASPKRGILNLLSAMPILQYLFVFAQAHDEFRIPELLSVSELYGFDVHLPEKPDATRPFMVIGLDEEEHALKLARRCILIKCLSLFLTSPDVY